MPFQSEAQRRFLWKFHPTIARRWSHKYGSKPVRWNKVVEAAKKKRKQKGQR